MSSTRLPGKVMADLVGAPMILRQIERLKRAKRLDQIVVATSTDASDDGLAERLVAEGIGVYRGSLEDVLGRFVGALETFSGHETVVRLTADCPLADPDVIDETIALFEGSKADYASNTPERRSYPKGLDIEVMRAAIRAVLAGETWTPSDVDLGAPADKETADTVRRLASLTPQQVRVLMMLSEGLLNKQIAYELSVSEATVKAHVSAILQKLGVESRTQAVIAASKIEAGQWQSTADA